MEREISRWDGFNPKNHHGRIYLGENAFSAQNRNDKLLLSLSIASVSLVFLSRTIVSIYIYFHRTTTTSFLPGESLDPPQFRPILTSIERFGVIRCCIPRRGDEFRSNRGSFYFVRHVYIIRAASMRTQECIHRRRRSGWVKINCSELQLCMESVSGWSVIFNALIWSRWGNVSRWDPSEEEEEEGEFFFGIDGVGCLVDARMKDERRRKIFGLNNRVEVILHGML